MKIERVMVEDLWKIHPNKYESIVVIAKEARRRARWAKERNIKLTIKPTDLAIRLFLEGKVRYKKVKKVEEE